MSLFEAELLRMLPLLQRKVMWYARRLSVMSPTEIAYRAVEQLKRQISRVYMPSVDAWIVDLGDELPTLPGVQEALKRLANDPDTIDRLAQYSTFVAKGRLSLLGQTWPSFELTPNWRLDPVTRRPWPATHYCFDIQYRDPSDFGDIKYVWELSRLQYLHPVAALAALRKDDNLTALCARHIESWIDSNPPFVGVHWISGIELALRVVSILLVSSLLGNGAFDIVQRKKILRTLVHHGYWLARYPSRFSSANNHLVAEAGALFLLGSLMPSLQQGKAWATRGRRTLEQEVMRQFYDDGVGAEQSPSYQAFSLEWFLLCGYLGNAMGEEFSHAYWKRLEACGAFLRDLIDEGGHVPRIGDDDEGCVVFDSLERENYISSVLGCLSLLLKRPEFGPHLIQPGLRQALYGTVTAGRRTSPGVRHYPAGGYTIARSKTGRVECVFIFDHGPLGYLSIAAHGHADTLAIWLHVAGRPVLVDAGTYLYYSGAAWRDYFRGSHGHNTLSVRGADSSIVAGPFNWSHKARTDVRTFRDSPTNWLIEAEHFGFVSRYGVRHRRRLQRLTESLYLITDLLIGWSGPHDAEVGFLLAPDLSRSYNKDKDAWRVSAPAGPILSIRHTGDLTGRIQSGLESPMQGWYSPGFGVKIPTRRLVFEGQLSAGVPASFELSILPNSLRNHHLDPPGASASRGGTHEN